MERRKRCRPVGSSTSLPTHPSLSLCNSLSSLFLSPSFSPLSSLSLPLSSSSSRPGLSSSLSLSLVHSFHCSFRCINIHSSFKILCFFFYTRFLLFFSFNFFLSLLYSLLSLFLILSVNSFSLTLHRPLSFLDDSSDLRSQYVECLDLKLVALDSSLFLSLTLRREEEERELLRSRSPSTFDSLAGGDYPSLSLLYFLSHSFTPTIFYFLVLFLALSLSLLSLSSLSFFLKFFPSSSK